MVFSTYTTSRLPPYMMFLTPETSKFFPIIFPHCLCLRFDLLHMMLLLMLSKIQIKSLFSLRRQWYCCWWCWWRRQHPNSLYSFLENSFILTKTYVVSKYMPFGRLPLRYTYVRGRFVFGLSTVSSCSALG